MSEIKINSQGEVKLFDSDNSNYIGLKAPGTVSSDQTFILPDADGSANNALKTDGSGNLGFVDVTTLVTQGIDWQSTLKTGDFTAVSGEGYFINTTSGAITATLPASPSAGNIVAFKDYAATFATNNLTIGRNSSNIQGSAQDSLLSTNRASVVLVYVDATKGWLYVQESNVGNLEAATYIVASGGTETTSGDYKIHTFTGSGTFTVSSVGNTGGGGAGVSYVVVAGGAGGGARHGGGGGAGGFREGKNSGDPYNDPYSASPLNAPSGITVTAQAYPITIGGGGAGISSAPYEASAGNGVNSVFSTITSAGGGHGGGYNIPGNVAESGGSGGGGGGNIPGSSAGGTGNTPPVSPPQGSSGGSGASGGCSGAGAGGATAAGGNTPVSGAGTQGGAGAESSITGSPVTRAGGGGGCPTGPAVPGGGTVPGGAGGGGNGVGNAGQTAGNGTANTGGGGGGNRSPGGTCGASGSGGSGVVIIRYKYQN